MNTSPLLTDQAVAFVTDLQRRFGPRRDELLAARRRAGPPRDFLADTAEVRAADWQVAPAPPALLDRRVEITGPTQPKMAVNALNSGARVWLADLEDCLLYTSPSPRDGLLSRMPSSA